MKKSLSLLLFCFLGVLPAAYADPTYEGIGTRILYVVLTPVLLIYTLIAMFKFMAAGSRKQMQTGSFVLVGILLHGIWLLSAFNFWDTESLRAALTEHVLKTVLILGIHLFNIFGFCLLLSMLFGNGKKKVI